MKKHTALLCAFGVLGNPIPLLADELGPIVVTGTKTEIELSKSAVPVEVITNETIRNSAAVDAADLLEQHANVDVARNGDYGKVTSVFIRGAESNHTLVLIDGVKMNPASIGVAALQNISPSMIERIEVVKGPRSSIYGSEAIGGVINIITRRTNSGAQLEATAGVGDDNIAKAGVSARYGNDSLSAGIYVESYETDGFPVNDASDEDHGFENQTLNAYLDFYLGRSDFRLSHWQADGNVEYYAFGDLDQDFENQVSSASWDYAFSGQLNSSLRFSTIKDDIQQNQPNFLSEFDFATTTRDEIEWKLDYQTAQELLLSVGLYSADEKVDARSFGTSFDESNDISATYLIAQQTIDTISYSASVRQNDHEDFDDETTWNLDYRQWIADDTNVYAGIGTAFRTPDFTDRFGSIGNPDLEPEESRSAEIGVQQYFTPQNVLVLSIFVNEIDNLIEPNASFTQVENIEEAEIKGVELSFQGQRDQWGYSLAMLSQDPENKTLNETLSRRASSRIKAGADYRAENWQAGGNIVMVGPRDNSSFDSIQLESYQLLNLYGRYQINKSIDVSLKLDNALDEDYETASGFNTAGRTAYAEFSFSLQN